MAFADTFLAPIAAAFSVFTWVLVLMIRRDLRDISKQLADLKAQRAPMDTVPDSQLKTDEDVK